MTLNLPLSVHLHLLFPLLSSGNLLWETLARFASSLSQSDFPIISLSQSDFPILFHRSPFICFTVFFTSSSSFTFKDRDTFLFLIFIKHSHEEIVLAFEPLSASSVLVRWCFWSMTLFCRCGTELVYVCNQLPNLNLCFFGVTGTLQKNLEWN